MIGHGLLRAAAGTTKNTVFLLRSNTTHGSQVFVDLSKNASAYSGLVGAIHSTDQKKFGASSIYFDGDDDYLEFPNHADFDFTSVDFTVDYWVYFPETSGQYACPISQTSGVGYMPWKIVRQDTQDKIQIGNAADTATLINDLFGTFTTGAWIHYAIVRDGANIYTYKNGTRVTNTNIGASTEILKTTNPLALGVRSAGTRDRYCNCYLDEIRISRGIARWTGASFTLPTTFYAID